ncbi:glycosyltransferase family 9 protein [Sulfurimonas sp.]|uniref:glycosyltransferase family 9 protein n=1 Tax=Sulfurimonas sp. TaxID=2022749 RepID=UPI0025FF2DC4|nr:glycosyltransferase family 9 protein [Sulfurimonas sp.]MDD5156435.1 glycosyltransferase family 9 protein [Sulfurimonas sp.]
MNLLITRHDKIGDFVVTLPLFKAIKEQYPNTKITALVSKINYQFASQIDFIDNVILYDKNDFMGTLRRIRAHKFDASISGFIDTNLGVLLFLSGIKQRVAPSTKLAQFFFNKTVAQRRNKAEKTEWQYNLDLAKEIFADIKLDFSRPLIKSSFSTPSSQKTVALHPGFGGSSDGNLKLDDYLRLAKRASELQNTKVVFTFGPDDTKSKEYIESHLDFKAELLVSKMSLMEFCQFLAGCELFISTSTGPMHLAGAVNTNTLSFFGNTLFASALRWATVSEKSRQHNFMIPADYDENYYNTVESKMIEIVTSR